MKEKIKIFIDFEAISNNFVKRIFRNVPNYIEYPYMFTVGFYKNDQLYLDNDYIQLDKIKNIQNLYYETYFRLKQKLIKSIRKITKNPNLNIDSESVEFLVWGNSLEDNIIYPMFGFKTTNLQKGHGVSLDRMIPQNFFKNNYFDKMYQIPNQDPLYKGTKIKLKPEFTSGAMCSVLAGIIILNNFDNSIQHNKYSKLLTNEEVSIIIDCIKNYNQDDVKKTAFLYKHLPIKEIIENETYKLHKKINKLNNEKNKLIFTYTTLNFIKDKIAISENETILDGIDKIINFYADSDTDSELEKIEKIKKIKQRINLQANFFDEISNIEAQIKKVSDKILFIREKIIPNLATKIFSKFNIKK